MMIEVKKKKRRRTRRRKGESLTEARYRLVIQTEQRWMEVLSKALTRVKDAQKRRRYYERKFADERAARAEKSVRRRVSLGDDV